LISYLSPAGFKILAHRGSTEGGAVENTIEAFRFALDSGVTYLETDVQATKDGIAVLFHDSTLERIANSKLSVARLNLDELQSLKLPGSSRIPTLLEVLERFPEAKFNLDVKTAGAIEPTIMAIKTAGATDRVLVSSFSPKRRVAAIRGLSGVATSADARVLVLAWLATKIGSKELLKRVLADIDALQIPPRAGFLRFDTVNFIQAIHAIGLEIHYWTINEIADAERLVALGADGIVTDQSKMMIERFGSKKPK
jgi:glycerophosphoryl diester phosphodiesterase